MTPKLTGLFFSTAKKMMRLQSRALKLSKPLSIPRKKKPAKATSRKVLAKPSPSMGTGVWCKGTYQREPSSTDLLGELNFFTYRPTAHPSAGLPLVVMLHGCHQTALDLAQGTEMNQLADQKGFVVLYPQQSRRVDSQRCWRWFEPDKQRGLAEADDIARLIRATTARLKLDRSRVYIAGLSAGAGMAGLVAVRHPELVAALGMHSGPVLGAARNMRTALTTMRSGTKQDPAALIQPLLEGATTKFPGMPAIIIQGQKDRVVSATNAKQLLQQFTYLNSLALGEPLTPARTLTKATEPTLLGKGTTREYTRVDVTKASKNVVRLCIIEQLGHAWSGGNSAVKFHSRTGPRASLLMWQFFSKHALP